MRARHHWVIIAAAIAILCPFLVSRASPRDPVPASQWQTFQKTVQPFFAKHCFACHADKESGDVRLDQFSDESSLAKGLPTLARSLEMLHKHAMPPKKRPRPRDDEIEPVIAWLEGFVARSNQQTQTGHDRAVIRRLNRVEYNNTVRDLLGVEFQPADDFPPDVPGHGFDTVSGTLTVSPVLVEKYLAAAEKVARTAVFGPPPMKPERVAHQPRFAADAFSK